MTRVDPYMSIVSTETKNSDLCPNKKIVFFSTYVNASYVMLI